MPERLQKFLARAGVASRRHAEALITDGRVSVNNQVVTVLGTKVEPGEDLVTVDGKLVSLPESRSYYVFYKPPLVVTTLDDPQGRASIASYVGDLEARVFPVGRLDYDAEGALLLTDDGELAHKLTHPSYQVPRTYLAKVKGTPSVETLDKLRAGVRLEDGMATPENVHIFEKVEKNTWLQITVTEGRQHLIKRMCAAIGHPVVRLFRPSYAGIGVAGLGHGQLRPLSDGEVEDLNAVAEGRVEPKKVDARLPPRRHGHGAPNLPGSDPDDVIESESRQGGQRVPTRKSLPRSWDDVGADEGQVSEEFVETGRRNGFKKGAPGEGRAFKKGPPRGEGGRANAGGFRKGPPRGEGGAGRRAEGGRANAGFRKGPPRGEGGAGRAEGGRANAGFRKGPPRGEGGAGRRAVGERSGVGGFRKGPPRGEGGFGRRAEGERSGVGGFRKGPPRGEGGFGRRAEGGRAGAGGFQKGPPRGEGGFGRRAEGGRAGAGGFRKGPPRSEGGFKKGPPRGEGGFGRRAEGGGRPSGGSKSGGGKPFRAGGKPAFGARPGGGKGRFGSGPKRPGGPKRGR